MGIPGREKDQLYLYPFRIFDTIHEHDGQTHGTLATGQQLVLHLRIASRGKSHTLYTDIRSINK